MITLISFILVLVGCLNWLCIGILQFDFVAGIFGSQANIFSRIVYVVIGIAAVLVCINLIKNKGKLTFNMKKLNKETMKKEPVFVSESSSDSAKVFDKTNSYETNSFDKQHKNYENNQSQIETSSDMSYNNHPSSPLNSYNKSNCNNCEDPNCNCNNKNHR